MRDVRGRKNTDGRSSGVDSMIGALIVVPASGLDCENDGGGMKWDPG